MRLLSALADEGIPDPSNLEELTAFGDGLYGRIDSQELADADATSRAATEYSPEFAALAEAAYRAADPHASRILHEVAQVLPSLQRLVFLDTADVALQCPNLIQMNARPLATALASRIESERSDNGLQAYAYLEVLTRIGLTQPSARLRALDLMLSITSCDSSDFLERTPRLVGLALDLWRESDLTNVLETLTEFEETRVDAQYELAHVQLRTALEESSVAAIFEGLTKARDLFGSVEYMEEAREDAEIFGSALDMIMAFTSSGSTGSAVDTSEIMDKFSNSIARRLALTSRSSMGNWAAPRQRAEVEWYTLADVLRKATGPLAQASWLQPIETLSLVLDAYKASRAVTVMTTAGLQRILEPVVETAFIRREGLVAHLQDALEAHVEDLDVDTAQRLLDAITSSPSGSGTGDDVGKVWAAAPALAAELGLGTLASPEEAAELARAVVDTPEAVAWMNRAAEERARRRDRRLDPVVDDLLSAVLDGLNECDDLTGIAREEFFHLLTELLRFAADRADVGRGSGGPTVSYLFPPVNGQSFTEDYLQRDIGSWLGSSPLRRYTRLEEPDVAAGRADITVTREHRLVIEVKRETRDASGEAIHRSYAGQAAAYTVAGLSVSIAAVLDLTNHANGVPSLKDSVWVDEVDIPGGSPRYVVVVVVRGNRPVPREVRAPAHQTRTP